MDDESLFGSPPPTPTRGRSPSPALALPNVSANIINLGSSYAQNVGTIALPGSHNFSELPVNPLALSLSYSTPLSEDALRPPAQTRNGFITQVKPRNPVCTPPLLPAPMAKKPAKTPRARSQTAPRPTPPPIHLPDPSQPLPLNLLRNQPGLLGTAGVVAGVLPAHLPAAPGPGMTSTNPIFVDDEPQTHTKSRKRPLPDVDVASLPAPSNQDIVSMLISEREIFPLLESILKFIATTPPRAGSETPSLGTSDAGSRSNTPSSESGAAKKRRKLRQVPAGAHLWDVPFPFNEGEGPAAYRNEWEKDRGKALVAELIRLIKDAAKKAALKNYLEQTKTPTEAQLASLSKYYRVETLFYNTPKSSETEVLADASNTTFVESCFGLSPHPLSSNSPITSHSPSNSTPFDQLITSLLSASSSQQLSSSGGGSSDGFFDSSAPLDASLFNSWMDILEAFPMPAEGFTPDFKNEELHIDPRQTFLTMPESLAQQGTTNFAPPTFDFPPDFTQAFPEASTSNTSQNFYPTTLDDFIMDPALLATLSADVGGSLSNFSDSGCPSLAGSPIPSDSSYSFGPMTPTETGWNGDSNIAIFSPGEGERFPTPARESQPAAQPTAGTSNGKKRAFGEMAGWTSAEKEALSFLEVLSKSKLGSKGKGKGKAKAEDREDGNVAEDEFSKVPTVPIVGALVRADVLQAARQRREELVAQIVKARVALWETTIEGGVLAGLVKHYSTG
ncbi:hypothetical protein K438DRAFT_1963507 [Mycena galopus ATCC 62051]|nr:hypothetical protein K438DRAFT_1963507 [Mycena galopus ATCC 62051]